MRSVYKWAGAAGPRVELWPRRSHCRNHAHGLDMAIPKHCGRSATGRPVPGFRACWPRYTVTNTSIAPTARQRDGSRRTRAPAMPPSAAEAGPAARASCCQCSTPSGLAPAWLRVANTGEMNTASAPARRPRRASAMLCAEAVRRGSQRGAVAAARPPRRCSPARSAAARRQSPATDSRIARARQARAIARPSARRPGASSCRNTTPHRRGGRRSITASGSGSRSASVNSHSGGTRRPSRPCRALTRRAHPRR